MMQKLLFTIKALTFTVTFGIMDLDFNVGDCVFDNDIDAQVLYRR